MTEQRYCKRLIEVDLPIKRISEQARREKSIRQGHIATLHIWWARRPLAACRAVLCAALWPDPVDSLCPEKFRKEAARLMKEFRDKRGGKPKNWSNPIELREALLDFIAAFADWDNSHNQDFLRISHDLISASYECWGGTINSKPIVLDPFAGGGSIPLEALRIGADAFSSDLNPIPVLLNKVILEYIPKYGHKLAAEIRKWGDWVKEKAMDELSSFYPKNSDNSIPIAYLWVRTIQCEGPSCGATIPLMNKLWLARKGSNSTALRMKINQQKKDIDFEILRDVKLKDVKEGTVRRGNVVCPICGFTTVVTSVRKQLKQRNGGANDAKLVAVRINELGGGRGYRLPTEDDLIAIQKAKRKLLQIRKENPELIPKESLPINPGEKDTTLGFRVQGYGITKWEYLFSDRQLLALVTFVKLVKETGALLKKGHDKNFAEAVQVCLAMVVDRLADFNSSLCILNVVGGRGVVHTFGRQALPMVWDFAETNPFNEIGANWEAGIIAFEETIKNESIISDTANVQIASAIAHPLPNDAVHCFFTDPPYYDAVPFGDLSDFFYVWLKRSIGNLFPELFVGDVTNKDGECIVDEIQGKDNKYFEKIMEKSMEEGRRILIPNGIGIVMFAHKSTSGWESQLKAMLDAGWVITASWPIDTERPGRLRAQNSAALASSIQLICRPRENPDGSLRSSDIGDWRDVLQELPKRIHEWMPRLAKEEVVGADAIFACLGPALEIFSKYSHVEKANGEKVELREYLEQVWGAVAKEALNMIFEGARTEGFEEDARLTAMWLWTLSTGTNGNGDKPSGDTEEEADESESRSGKASLSGFSLEFDAARKIAQGLGAHLESLNSVVEIEGETARLLPVTERVRFLFGKDSTANATYKRKKKDDQQSFYFVKELAQTEGQGWSLGESKAEIGKTILDRLHQAMILFGAGRQEALRRFLVEEGVGKDDRFWRLAQALSALYPLATDEKRWVDGMLAKKNSFGF